MRSWAAGPAHLCGCGLTDVSCELVLIRLQVARVEYHTLYGVRRSLPRRYTIGTRPKSIPVNCRIRKVIVCECARRALYVR